MTPVEQWEYKRRWLPNGFGVSVHSDWDASYVRWLKDSLEPKYWYVNHFTDVYEHTYMFERSEDAELFADVFKEQVCLKK